jgi:hypothetical protein
MALAHVAAVKATDPRSVAAVAIPEPVRRRSRPLQR